MLFWVGGIEQKKVAEGLGWVLMVYVGWKCNSDFSKRSSFSSSEKGVFMRVLTDGVSN